MGVLGEMFPNRKLRSEAGEAGSGQGFRLGAIDLDSGLVEVHRGDTDPAAAPDPTHTDVDADPDDPTNGPVVG